MTTAICPICSAAAKLEDCFKYEQLLISVYRCIEDPTHSWRERQDWQEWFNSLEVW